MTHQIHKSFLIPIPIGLLLGVFYGCAVYRAQSIASNEVSAIKELQVIYEQEQIWHNKTQKYVPLGQLFSGDDAILSPNRVNPSYRFDVRLKENGKSFAALASPTKYNESGRRSFYMNEHGEIHCADRGGEEATPTDPAVK